MFGIGIAGSAASFFAFSLFSLFFSSSSDSSSSSSSSSSEVVHCPALARVYGGVHNCAREESLPSHFNAGMLSIGVVGVICAIIYVMRKTRAKIGTARTVVSFPDPHVLPRERESGIVLPGQALPFCCAAHAQMRLADRLRVT